jgi:hypothetical protein
MTNQATPRYEFRSFGQDFQQTHYLMSRLSVPVDERLWCRKSEEVYIVSDFNDLSNIKIRDGKLEIKKLEKKVDGFELWAPAYEEEFPLQVNSITEVIFPSLEIKAPVLLKDTYNINEFLELIRNHPYLLSVRVKKQRHAYYIHNTICEFVDILINGAKVFSIAAESTECNVIKETLSLLNMDDYENINYIKAIKRITGLSSGKLANE